MSVIYRTTNIVKHFAALGDKNPMFGRHRKDSIETIERKWQSALQRWHNSNGT